MENSLLLNCFRVPIMDVRLCFIPAPKHIRGFDTVLREATVRFFSLLKREQILSF